MYKICAVSRFTQNNLPKADSFIYIYKYLEDPGSKVDHFALIFPGPTLFVRYSPINQTIQPSLGTLFPEVQQTKTNNIYNNIV